MSEIHNIVEPLITAIQDFKNQGGVLDKQELQNILQRLLPDWKGTPEEKEALANELNRCLNDAPRRDQAIHTSQTIEIVQTLKGLLRLFSKKDLIDLIEAL